MISVIETTDLRHTFGTVEAISGVTFTVEAGELFGLVGPDGAGKTTTMRVIAGLLRPTGGGVRLWGTTWETDRLTLKMRIGYMGQRFSLYGDLTVSENVDFFAQIFGVREYHRRKVELLEWAGLAPFTGRLAERLSGGMKQKLALVCNLIHTPELLLLDEPTTGVDPISRREFWRILSDIRELGVTILVTTPYMDEAERCTRVALVHKGRILSCGDPVEMRSKEGRSDIEIVTDAPRRAVVWLREQPGVQDVTLLGRRVVCRYPPEQQIDHLIEGLKGLGIPVTGVRRTVPSFESLFMRMLE